MDLDKGLNGWTDTKREFNQQKYGVDQQSGNAWNTIIPQIH